MVEHNVPAELERQRLSIMLPVGQDIGVMSFTKEQREAQAAKQRKQNISTSTDIKTTRQHFILKAIVSVNDLRQQLDDSRPSSSSTKIESGKTEDSAVGNAEDWRDSEIPSELEWAHPEAPDEIRNIVQESMDEHRALQASRISATQAIVVRTTVTQSRTSDEDGPRNLGSSSSATASVRRTDSSMSGDMSNGRSMGIGSTTSLGSSERDDSSAKAPTIYNRTAYTTSQESLNVPTGLRATFRKTLKERGVFKYLTSRKGKEKDLGYQGDKHSYTSECTSCFDDIPNKKAVTLSCRHSYCSTCFPQLINTAICTESTFPPKCCLQEIPRKTMLAYLPLEDMVLFDEKALEYAVPIANRYYCASPECAKWIDVRRARGTEGALECPHCSFSVCTVCRGAAHGRNQDCPSDFGLDATLQQAERAGWQRCYNCRAVIELNTGCRHITCKCRAEFCYTCGAKWKSCWCTEVDQRQREDEIRRRLDRFEAEARAEEAEVKAAIAAVEAAERLVAEEREAENERLAEEARQLAQRELERVQEITDFFAHLRQSLETVRLQQKQAMQKRQRSETARVEEKERALVSGEQILDREHEVTSERVSLVTSIQEPIKSARKKHAGQLVETVGRHRKDQAAYLIKSSEELEADVSIDQTAVLEKLLQAQDLERSTLRSQQTREIQKLKTRAEVILQDFDERTEAARFERLEAQVREAAEVTRMQAALTKQIHADWKWFETIFLDRAMMLGEDERRIILSGADVPKSSYVSIFGRAENDAYSFLNSSTRATAMGSRFH